MGPGEEEDFRLVTVDGDTTVRGTDQDKGVVFILREKRRREREKRGREGERGWVKESTTTISETKERERNVGLDLV